MYRSIRNAVILATIVGSTSIGLIPAATAQGEEPVIASNKTSEQADLSIINGVAANPTEYPAFVQVIDRYVDQPAACGGTLLNSTWVLTSGNCVWQLDDKYRPTGNSGSPRDFSVKSPVTNQTVALRNIVLPGDFSGRIKNNTYLQADLALLQLAEPIEINEYTVLPKPNAPIPRSGHGYVWGYGGLNREGTLFDFDTFRKADVPINPFSDCGTHKSGLICAERDDNNGAGSGTCLGDSGSPLTIVGTDPKRMVQAGLASHSSKQHPTYYCGVHALWYTNLSDWTTWIKSVVGVITQDGDPLQPVPTIDPSPQPIPTIQPTPQPTPTLTPPSNSVPTPKPTQSAPIGNVPISKSLRIEPTYGQGSGSQISVEASNNTFDISYQPSYVLLTGENSWSDNLAATSLTQSGALLMSKSDLLEPEVIAQIQRLGTKHVIIVGGLKAVSPASELKLRSLGLSTYRLSGSNRVRTSVSTSLQALNMRRPNKRFSNSLVIARGYADEGASPAQAFADSISASVLAGATNSALALSESGRLSPDIITGLGIIKLEKVYLMGGEKALGKQIELDLASHFPGVTIERISGSNRADTAAKSSHVMSQSPTFHPTGVIVVDGSHPEAWKTAFSYSSYALKHNLVVALADGDTLPAESAALVKVIKSQGGTTDCVASAAACNAVDSIS